MHSCCCSGSKLCGWQNDQHQPFLATNVLSAKCGDTVLFPEAGCRSVKFHINKAKQLSIYFTKLPTDSTQLQKRIEMRIHYSRSSLGCALLCFNSPCITVLGCALVHFTVLYCAWLCFTVLGCALLCFIAFHCALLCLAVLYCALVHFTVLYCAWLCFTVLGCALLCSTVLYFVWLCFTVL